MLYTLPYFSKNSTVGMASPTRPTTSLENIGASLDLASVTQSIEDISVPMKGFSPSGTMFSLTIFLLSITKSLSPMPLTSLYVSLRRFSVAFPERSPFCRYSEFASPRRCESASWRLTGCCLQSIQLDLTVDLFVAQTGFLLHLSERHTCCKKGSQLR